MASVVKNSDLPGDHTSRQFEGYHHDAGNISFFINDTPPGRGPALHKHPYEEVFVVETGKLRFTAGDKTIEADGGQIVIVPADVPHKFINSGTDIAHHVSIHASGRMITEWLEE